MREEHFLVGKRITYGLTKVAAPREVTSDLVANVQPDLLSEPHGTARKE